MDACRVGYQYDWPSVLCSGDDSVIELCLQAGDVCVTVLSPLFVSALLVNGLHYGSFTPPLSLSLSPFPLFSFFLAIVQLSVSRWFS